MKRIFWGIFSTLLVSVALYFISFNLISFSEEIASGEVEVIATDSTTIEEPEPTILYGMVVDSMVVIEDRIKRNQNLSEILSSYNVSFQKIHHLAAASKSVFDVRKIVPNRKYTLICYPDSLNTAKAMIYEPSPTEYVVFNLEDTVTVEKVEKEIKVVERELAGTIEYSLSYPGARLYTRGDFAHM